ncbi:hypothetical protein BPTFM16_01300 [Altererythrobacter insulae]|nr:hypothetical protein BPTFM16_01300 [Altererythrobacter insulae]
MWKTQNQITVDDIQSCFNRVTMQNLYLDRPIKSFEEDRLERRSFVEHLADRLVAEGKSTGLIVGLIGPWGCGKTSVLNLLQNVLISQEKYGEPLVVRFNPWLISTRDDLIGHFFLELTRCLREKVGTYDVYSDGSDQRKDQAIEAIADYGSAISPLVSLVSPRLGHGFRFLSAFVERRRSQNSSLHLKREKVRIALRAFNFPIVVLIDELDRLEDSEVRSMAQLLRSVGDFDAISYAAAYDEERVVEALSSGNSESNKERGRSYLEKIVQIRVATPRMTFQKVEQVFREDLARVLALASITLSDGQESRLNRVIEHCIPALLSTSRDLSKVLSDYAGRLIGLEDSVDPIDLLGLTVLSNRSPDLFDELATLHADRHWTVSFPNTRSAHAFTQTRVLPNHNLPNFEQKGFPAAATELLKEILPQITGGHLRITDISNQRVILSERLSEALGQKETYAAHSRLPSKSLYQKILGSKAGWLARPENFTQVYELDDNLDPINSRNVGQLFDKVAQLAVANSKVGRIGSIELIQVASLLMRLQDRKPELRSPIRNSLLLNLDTPRQYLSQAYFANNAFVSELQNHFSGLFWQKPEAAITRDCLEKIARSIKDKEFKSNFAISLLLPRSVTEVSAEPLPADFRARICENSVTNINFADDLIDLFFSPKLWGTNINRKFVLEYVDPDTLGEALEIQSKILSVGELAKKQTTIKIARDFLRSATHDSAMIYA